jgi:hypothetical protein
MTDEFPESKQQRRERSQDGQAREIHCRRLPGRRAEAGQPEKTG